MPNAHSPVPEDQGRPSLSQRGRDLLAAIRADPVVQRQESPADRAIPTAYLLLADMNIDAEAAALSLTRQLAGPGQSAGGGVALLMLDPLGATLRLAKPAGPPAAAPVMPQYRVGNRGEWPDLLDRLPASVRLLLILDTTGQVHRLLDGGSPPPTTILVCPVGTVGRVAGYRKLKELDIEGVGQIGFFFAPQLSPPDEESGAAVVEGPQAAPAGSPRRVASGDLVAGSIAGGETEPFGIEQAQATFTRLAATAEQFLGRRVIFFGAVDPGRQDRQVTVELLGQRPSIGSQENRSGLVRWLAANSQPFAGEAPAVTPADVPRREEYMQAEQPFRSVGLGQPVAEPSGPPGGGQPVGGGQPEVPFVLRPAGSGGGEPSDLLAVIPLDRLPADEREWSDWLAANGSAITPGLTVLGFRPPIDPCTVLAAAPNPNRLLLIRRAGGDQPLPALAGLVAAGQWAQQHWPLLRLAFVGAGLPAAPQIEPVLVAEGPPESLAALMDGQAIRARVVELLKLDLSAARRAPADIGVVLRQGR